MAELIFVVDSDGTNGLAVRQCLEKAGYVVRTFSTTIELSRIQQDQPSLVLIGSALPNCDGLELCQRIRDIQTSRYITIILLTQENHSIREARHAGVDYVLSGPVTSRKLVNLVQAAIPRILQIVPAGDSDIVIDHRGMTVSVRGSEISTTTLEFRLVNYLAMHRGHTFTRDFLLDAVWGETRFVTPRSVDACIRRLREKIEPDANRPTYLKTVRGVGYRFDALAIWPSSAEGCECVVCMSPAATKGRSEAIRRVVS